MKTGFLKTMGLTAWAAGLLLLPAPTPAPASDLVEIVRVSTSKPYLLSGASSGAMPYVDRKATLTTLSPGVSQGVLVRTANKDAKVKTPEHLTLRVNRDAGVYVCYDPRAKRLPAWLDAPEWSPAPETVSTTEKGGSPMRVFFQRVAAGMEITLGGNHQGGNTGAKINYFVVVQPEEAPVCRPEAVFFVTPSVITAGEPVTLSWTSTHADTVEINRGIGFLPASGSMVLYPTQSLSYTFIATGPGGRVIIHDAVMVNPAFPARIIEPNGDQDVADVGFTIRWTAPKPADDTRVWLYYDLDPVGADGVLIVADLDASVNSYRWNTSGLAEGVYWVYAATHRGTSDPEVAYSPGPVTVNHDLFYETKLTVEDPKPALHFGNSVAISNDYAIIGADRHEGYQNRYRSVYVFKRCGSSWVEQIELTPPGGGRQRWFRRIAGHQRRPAHHRRLRGR